MILIVNGKTPIRNELYTISKALSSVVVQGLFNEPKTFPYQQLVYHQHKQLRLGSMFLHKSHPTLRHPKEEKTWFRLYSWIALWTKISLSLTTTLRPRLCWLFSISTIMLFGWKIYAIRIEIRMNPFMSSHWSNNQVTSLHLKEKFKHSLPFSKFPVP